MNNTPHSDDYYKRVIAKNVCNELKPMLTNITDGLMDVIKTQGKQKPKIKYKGRK